MEKNKAEVLSIDRVWREWLLVLRLAATHLDLSVHKAIIYGRKGHTAALELHTHLQPNARAVTKLQPCEDHQRPCI